MKFKTLCNSFSEEKLDITLPPLGSTLLYASALGQMVECWAVFAFIIMESELSLLDTLRRCFRRRHSQTRDPRWGHIAESMDLVNLRNRLDEVYSDSVHGASEQAWKVATQQGDPLQCFYHLRQLILPNDSSSIERARSTIIGCIQRRIEMGSPKESPMWTTGLTLFMTASRSASLEDWHVALSQFSSLIPASSSGASFGAVPLALPAPRNSCATGVTSHSYSPGVGGIFPTVAPAGSCATYYDSHHSSSSNEDVVGGISMKANLSLDELAMVISAIAEGRESRSFDAASHGMLLDKLSARVAALEVPDQRKVNEDVQLRMSCALVQHHGTEPLEHYVAPLSVNAILHGGGGRFGQPPPKEVYPCHLGYPALGLGEPPPYRGKHAVPVGNFMAHLHGDDCSVCATLKRFTIFGPHEQLVKEGIYQKNPGKARAYHQAWTCKHYPQAIQDAVASGTIPQADAERLLTKVPLSTVTSA